MDKVNLQQAFATFSEAWAPRVIGAVNDVDVKLARLDGAFVWHRHPDADELFFIVSGELEMRFRDRSITLRPGELLVVPRGVEHQPVTVGGPCQVMLVEPRGTLNTGDAPENERTVRVPERLGPAAAASSQDA
ncbi:MAG: cupin domain-containing protein [Myxococcota bacterium]